MMCVDKNLFSSVGEREHSVGRVVRDEGRMWMRARRVADRVVVGYLTAVAVSMMVSCSSDGRAGGLDLGTTVVTSATGPTTTGPPAPTTQPVAPTDPPTTPGPTTMPSPPVTDPPAATATPVPPTEPPVDSKQAQVRADYTAALAARLGCTYVPETCNYAAIAIFGSPMDMQTREVVRERVANNLRGKPGYGNISIAFESVGFEGDSAFVTICAHDTGVLFDIVDPANPDDDIVVNDSESSYRVRWEMRSQDGRWLMYEGTQIDRLDAGDLCAA